MKIKYFTILILMGIILVTGATIGIAEAIQLQVLVDTGSVYSAYKESDILNDNSTGSGAAVAKNSTYAADLQKIRDSLNLLNGTTASQFIKSGLGLTSRIVQIGFSDDQIWYGDASNTKIVSLQPYINVESNTKYAAIVPDQQTSSITSYNIPNLRDVYTRSGNVLNSAVGTQFNYDNYRNLIGHVSLTAIPGSTAVSVTGDGIAVIKLGDKYGENIKVSGNGIATHVLSNSTYNSLDLITDPYTRKGYTVVNGVVVAGGDVVNSVIEEDVAINSNLLKINTSWLRPDTFSDATPTNTTVIKHGFKIGGTIPDTNQTTNHIITPIPIGNAGETWGTASIKEYDELTYGQHATAPSTSVINKNHMNHTHGGHAHSHPTNTTYTNSGGGAEVDLAVNCATTNTCYAHGVAGKYEAVLTLTKAGLLNNVTAVSLAGAELWSRADSLESKPNIINLTDSILSTEIGGITYTNNKFYVLDSNTGRLLSLDVDGGAFFVNATNTRSNNGLTFYAGKFWSSATVSDRLILYTDIGTTPQIALSTPNINKPVTGMTSNTNGIWMTFQNETAVVLYNNGIFTNNFTLNIANTNPVGIAYHDDKFWILDDVDSKVYVYSATSPYSRLSADDFDLSSDNNLPSDIEVYNGMFYVLNNNTQMYIYGNNNNINYVLSTVSYSLYNTLPAATLASTQDLGFTGPHNKATDTSLLYVRPIDSTIPLDLTLSGATTNNSTGLIINNLLPNRLYQIVVGVNDLVIDTGITDSSGIITIPTIDSTYTSGKLLLYPDNILVYKDTFDTAVFDTVNNQAFKLTTNDKKIYTIHAYVKVPISSGPITIGNMTLVNSNNATLTLSYLDGIYNTGGEMYIPVVPGYKEIRMDVDGTASSLKYANVLGNSGVTIISSATSTIENSEATADILSAEAVASSTGYIIATADGEMQAVISETISGSLVITNTYELGRDIEFRERLLPIDPLSAYVDVYINGVKDGETIQIGINPFPDFQSIESPQIINDAPTLVWFVDRGAWIDSRNVQDAAIQQQVDALRQQVIRSVTYTYPDYTLSGTLSTNVNAGDFVEFHVYAKIFGEIDQFNVPPGWTLLSSSGESTSIANIRSAYVYADYITG